jgi:S1-C subfamily serine protease
VERVGWAGLAGLSFGDLIQRVNDREIRGIDDFRAVMADLAKTQPTRVIFAVLRDNRSTFLFAEPDWKPAIKQD